MAHQVQVNKDGVELPDGNKYDSGATVTLTDHEFALIAPGAFTGGSPILTDLGHVVGTADTLADLGDVDISDPQVGDVVKWGGSHWVNAQPDADIDVGGGGGAGGLLPFTTSVSFGFEQDTLPSTDPVQSINRSIGLPFMPPKSFNVSYADDSGAGSDLSVLTYDDTNFLSPIPDVPWAMAEHLGGTPPYTVGLVKIGLYAMSMTFEFEESFGGTGLGTRGLFVDIPSGDGGVGCNQSFFSASPSATAGVPTTFVGTTMFVITAMDLLPYRVADNAQSPIPINVTPFQSSGTDGQQVLGNLTIVKVL